MVESRTNPWRNVQILEEKIKELQERLRTSNEHLKAIMERKLRLSETKILIPGRESDGAGEAAQILPQGYLKNEERQLLET